MSSRAAIALYDMAWTPCLWLLPLEVDTASLVVGFGIDALVLLCQLFGVFIWGLRGQASRVALEVLIAMPWELLGLASGRRRPAMWARALAKTVRFYRVRGKVTRRYRGFFADRGGPIILGQIENELHIQDSQNDGFQFQEYVDFCGQLADDSGVDIAWGKKGVHALLDDDAIPGGMLIDILYDLTVTKDGGITVAVANQEMQGRMLKAIGLLHLLEDERFDTMQKLVENLHIFRGLVAERCLEYTSDELLALLREVEVPCARCLNRDEVLAQEQLSANDSIAEVDHPHLGTLRVVKAPPRFGGERLEPSLPVPAHGEHTDSVLTDFGLDSQRINTLRSEGVLG